ncbi:YceI family protein [Carboxylicivirga linearis]|uniref:YceI family protein n=1 Tax=Carboxylicivirga linearis TaxID=1628157 RepID=A0ABS5JYP6_9BACT|nr:YceI family protein [Carboxylicivirga linearis]MBS2100027.1 YceI family protein [Carboxylicivirga linearis]
MKQLIAGVIGLFFISTAALSQSKYKADEGMVSFFSSAPLEDIYAENKTVVSLVDLSTREIAFVITIVDFQFEKSLMQTHFNDKYMESHKYPKATFLGNIISPNELKNPGNYKVKVKGDLTIHGVIQNIEVDGEIIIGEAEVEASSEFTVKLEDYKVKIPRLLVRNIAEEVLVKINLTYYPVQP